LVVFLIYESIIRPLHHVVNNFLRKMGEQTEFNSGGPHTTSACQELFAQIVSN